MVISSQVAACPVPPGLGSFKDHLSTHACMAGPRKKPQQKQTNELLAVIYTQTVSILAKLSSDGEKCTLT